jgi:hypothetical protein
MGFGSGSDIMNDVIAQAKKRFPGDPRIRLAMYLIVIRALDGHDWDTHGECLGLDPEFDAALAVIHPAYKED